MRIHDLTKILPATFFLGDTGTILATSPQLDKISLDYPLYLNLLDSTGNILQQAELTECAGILSAIVTFPSAPLVFYQLQGHDIGANPFKKTISDYDVTFRPPNLRVSLLNTYLQKLCLLERVQFLPEVFQSHFPSHRSSRHGHELVTCMAVRLNT